MGPRPRDTAADLERLQQFFAELLTQGAYAKVTVSVQQGKVGMVHVDRSYTVDQLPRTDG
jgi:hypothetical protein